jgi:hypothetical protein
MGSYYYNWLKKIKIHETNKTSLILCVFAKSIFNILAPDYPGWERREQLQEVLEDWILFRIYKNLFLSVIDFR